MSIESEIPSNHLIFCCPLLLLPSIFPSIRVFSSVLALHIRWPKDCSFSISPSTEYSGLIFFRIDWFDLLGIQELSDKLSLCLKRQVHLSSWNWESQPEAETLTGCQVQMPILQMGKLSSASPDLRFLKAGPWIPMRYPDLYFPSSLSTHTGNSWSLSPLWI